MIASVVAALIVFVGFGIPPAVGHSVYRVDPAGNTQTNSIQIHWSAIVLVVLVIVGLVMMLLPNKK